MGVFIHGGFASLAMLVKKQSLQVRKKIGFEIHFRICTLPRLKVSNI